MNLLLIAVIALIVISAIIGYRRGLLGIIYNLFSWIFIAGFVIIASGYIQYFITEHTTWYELISERVISMLIQAGGETMSLVINAMPRAYDGVLSLSDSITAYIMRGIACIIAFVIAKLICSVVAVIIKHIQKLPILRGLTSWIGMILGVFKGLFITWLFMFVVSLLLPQDFGRIILPMIESSSLLTFIYENNLLVELFYCFW